VHACRRHKSSTSQQYASDVQARSKETDWERACHSKTQEAGGAGCCWGYHEVAGMKVKLKKPLLVLRKKVSDGAGDQEPLAAEVELEVIGIIWRATGSGGGAGGDWHHPAQILFKDRPKALNDSACCLAPMHQHHIGNKCVGSNA